LNSVRDDFGFVVRHRLAAAAAHGTLVGKRMLQNPTRSGFPAAHPSILVKMDGQESHVGEHAVPPYKRLALAQNVNPRLATLVVPSRFVALSNVRLVKLCFFDWIHSTKV